MKQIVLEQTIHALDLSNSEQKTAKPWRLEIPIFGDAQQREKAMTCERLIL